MLAQAVANSIATSALVVIPYAVMGRWPPQEMLLMSGIGGALSPLVWRVYRAARGGPPGSIETDGIVPPSSMAWGSGRLIRGRTTSGGHTMSNGAWIGVGVALGAALGASTGQLALSVAIGAAIGAGLEIASHLARPDLNKRGDPADPS
jgi:hypothetical protein